MNLKPLPKLELLQALRALAALAVVFFHTGFQPGYGEYGVNVFFVLSGVIMAMLFGAENLPGQFLQRRLIRIIPLYWAMTTVAVLLRYLTAPDSFGKLGGAYEYILSLFFVPFRARNDNICPVLGPGWTINYEVAFYCTCAVGLFLSRHRPALVTASLVVFWWFCSGFSSSTAGQFYHRTIVFYFVAGIFLWHLSSVIKYRSRSLWCLILIPAICGVLAYLEFRARYQQSPYLLECLRAILCVVVVAVALFFEPAFQRISSRIRLVLIEIGDASYALYLSHLFIINLVFVLARKLGIGDANLGLAVGTMIASTVVAILIHRHFDSPIQKKLRSYFRPKPIAR